MSPTQQGSSRRQLGFPRQSCYRQKGMGSTGNFSLIHFLEVRLLQPHQCSGGEGGCLPWSTANRLGGQEMSKRNFLGQERSSPAQALGQEEPLCRVSFFPPGCLFFFRLAGRVQLTAATPWSVFIPGGQQRPVSILERFPACRRAALPSADAECSCHSQDMTISCPQSDFG